MLDRIDTIVADPLGDDDSNPNHCIYLQLGASSPHADVAFQKSLMDQVMLKLEAQQDFPVQDAGERSSHWLNSITSRPLRMSLVAALVLALSLGMAWPVWGQAVSRHFVSREVKQVPTPQPGAAPPARTSDLGRRWMDLDELQRRVGFVLLVPTYLPPGCTATERFLVDFADAVYFNYSCVSIGQQAGHDTSPLVGEGSSEPVTVSGMAAIYVDGTWFGQPGKEIWSAA
ncbi:MAG: hypothetical protein ACR2PL_03080 [Dehalococcoidia bacterium]